MIANACFGGFCGPIRFQAFVVQRLLPEAEACDRLNVGNPRRIDGGELRAVGGFRSYPFYRIDERTEADRLILCFGWDVPSEYFSGLRRSWKLHSIERMPILRFALLAGFAVVGCGWAAPNAAFAQGLLWNLPPDGTWVRYEGEYTEVNTRETVEENETLQWVRHVWLKSVGQTEAEYNGKMVSCRWIEIKVITGKESDGVLDPGPVGASIYKVLVPESEVTGRVVDEDEIVVSFIPIVQGWKVLGQGEPQPLSGQVLQIYPVVSLLMHYRALEPVSASPVDPEVGIGPITAEHVKGVSEMENRSFRSTNTGELWRSDEVPFGLARWSVTITREEKSASQPRSEFQLRSRITESMKAQETGTDAQSELALP
jgi:hypothetical protein